MMDRPKRFRRAFARAQCKGCGKPIFQINRDAKAPLVADDWDFEHGWQVIPLPPTLDEKWVIVDSLSDKKTGWIRVKDLSRDVRP